MRGVFDDPSIQFALGEDGSIYKRICLNLVEFLDKLKNKEGKSGRMKGTHEQMKRIILYAATGFHKLPPGVEDEIADTLKQPKLHKKFIWDVQQDGFDIASVLDVTQKVRSDKRRGANIITEGWHALCETKKGANQVTRIWLPEDEQTAQQR